VFLRPGGGAGQDGRDVGGGRVAGGQRGSERPAFPQGPDQGRVAVPAGDDGPGVDVGGHGQGGDADPGLVEPEAHLAGRGGRVGRIDPGRCHVIVGAAVFVERDQEQSVGEIGAAGGAGRAHGGVDAGQQVLPAQDRGRWVGRDSWGHRVKGRVVVVVRVDQAWLDERV